MLVGLAILSNIFPTFLFSAIIVNGSSPLGADQAQKKKIAAFLTRVMHGKDVGKYRTLNLAMAELAMVSCNI